jgi:hypothetical protein
MAVIEGKVLMLLTVGFTHFVDIGKPEDALIYYKNATEVQMLIPGASLMTGTWSILPDGYFVKWKDGPEGKWQITHADGVMTYIDPTGKPAGKVTKIVPGGADRF